MQRDIHEGAEFFCVSGDEFGAINNAANKMGLMAYIFAIEDDAAEKEISFVIVRADQDKKLN